MILKSKFFSYILCALNIKFILDHWLCSSFLTITSLPPPHAHHHLGPRSAKLLFSFSSFHGDENQQFIDAIIRVFLISAAFCRSWNHLQKAFKCISAIRLNNWFRFLYSWTMVIDTSSTLVPVCFSFIPLSVVHGTGL